LASERFVDAQGRSIHKAMEKQNREISLHLNANTMAPRTAYLEQSGVKYKELG
jgi:hypothetical protein